MATVKVKKTVKHQVTFSYNDEQWAALDGMARAVGYKDFMAYVDATSPTYVANLQAQYKEKNGKR